MNFRMNEEEKIRKATLANIDNCGDFICGKPLLNKEFLKKNKIKK